MGVAYGVVAAAAQFGLNAILVKPKRGIGPFVAHVTVSERHTDELEISDHPVEQGAQISDHAFKRPPEVVIECVWSDSPRVGTAGGALGAVGAFAAGRIGGSFAGSVATGVLSKLIGNSADQVKDVYEKLLTLQQSVILFDVHTGKRTYKNMLLKRLEVETDRDREHVLAVTAVCRQVLIATVRTVNVAAANQADPQSTLSPVAKGVKQLSSAAKSFNLRSAVDALTPSGLESARSLTP